MTGPASLFSRIIRHGHGAVAPEDTYLFTRQLHVLQKAGVPLLSGLQALQAQLPSGRLRRVLGDVHHDLLDGKTFSQALGRHPAVFNPVFLSLIRVGESGGLLEDTLQQLAQLFEWEIEVRNRLQQALQYPLIVLSFLCGALTLMAIFVLPRFAEMYRSFKITLPLATRLLIWLSSFLTHWGWLAALLMVIAGAGLWSYVRTGRGRLQWDTWMIRVPVVGPIVLQLSMSRMARVTAALNHSGVSILETLALAGESVNNTYVRARMHLVRERVQRGVPLASAMKDDAVFPPVVVQMVATGEETGRLDELLRSVSDYYDQQVAYTVKRLITYLEPLILGVVAVGVVVMAVAVYVPMWDLAQIFQHQGR